MTFRPKIEAANKDFMNHFGNRDAKSLASLYTDQGQVLPASSPIIEGQADIATFWQGVFDAGIIGVTLKTVELDGSNNVLTEVGQYTLTTADGTTADTGKYIVIWRNVGGRWKLDKDMFNSSMPAS